MAFHYSCSIPSSSNRHPIHMEVVTISLGNLYMYAGCRIHMIMSLDNFMIYTSFSISSSYIQVTSICMCVCLYICDWICENPPCRELCAIIFTGVLLSPVIKSRNQYFCRYERINLSSTFLYVQTNQNGVT